MQAKRTGSGLSRKCELRTLRPRVALRKRADALERVLGESLAPKRGEGLRRCTVLVDEKAGPLRLWLEPRERLLRLLVGDTRLGQRVPDRLVAVPARRQRRRAAGGEAGVVEVAESLEPLQRLAAL